MSTARLECVYNASQPGLEDPYYMGVVGVKVYPGAWLSRNSTSSPYTGGWEFKRLRLHPNLDYYGGRVFELEDFCPSYEYGIYDKLEPLLGPGDTGSQPRKQLSTRASC